MLVTRIAVKNLQIPANGLTVAEARALVVQSTNKEPAVSTLEPTENGETTMPPSVANQ